MRTATLLLAVIFLSVTLRAQNAANYILEINGDTVSLALDGTKTFKNSKGQTYTLKLKQKEVLHYEDAKFSFQYPANYTVSSEKIDDDITQLLCFAATGDGFLIQSYKDINPENMVDLMLEEMTKESVDAGYKETITTVQHTLGSGKVLTGKRSTLTLDDDTSAYEIYPVKSGKGGLLIVHIILDSEDEKAAAAKETFWKTIKLK